MNLDTNDLEMIRTTVEAAVAKATNDLVKESTFKEFRQEVLADRALFVQREVFELELKRRDEELDRLNKEVRKAQNILSNAWVRGIGIVAGLIEIVTLWQLFQK